MTQLKKYIRYQVTTIPKIVNEKGITIEWCRGVTGKQVSIYVRKKGTRFAQHYHSGIDPSKNPERFFLVSGKVKFTFVDFDKKNREEVTVTEHQEMLIYPNVPHLAEAIEDSVFVEYRQTKFDQLNSDTHPLPVSIFEVNGSK